MKVKGLLITALGCAGAMAVLGQTPAAPQQGQGVQAPADARYADWIATKCKTPPRGGGGGGGAGAGAAGRGGGAPAAAAQPAGPPAHRDYTVTEIPCVIAAGQKWKSIWTARGNNADGIIAAKDGGILAAQNTDSAVLQIDKDGKVSTPYKDTNTSGALSMNKKGELFLVARALPASVMQIAPTRKVLANMYNGEPLDCLGGTINDLTADSKGGAYFTMGGVYYANPQGVVSKYGTITGVNGLILSPDERTLYVTGRVPSATPAPAAAPAPAAQPGAGGRGGGAGGGLVAFSVQADGSLTNERQLATFASGGDGSAVDAQGRIYVTSPQGQEIHVISPDGKVLGSIPTPLGFITAAFSGPDKKTLYGVANNRDYDEIFTIPMIAQGYRDRAK